MTEAETTGFTRGGRMSWDYVDRARAQGSVSYEGGKAIKQRCPECNVNLVRSEGYIYCSRCGYDPGYVAWWNQL